MIQATCNILPTYIKTMNSRIVPPLSLALSLFDPLLLLYYKNHLPFYLVFCQIYSVLGTLNPGLERTTKISCMFLNCPPSQ